MAKIFKRAKAKTYKHTDDLDRVWYEVVWFTNYGTKDQEIHFNAFDTQKEAEEFIYIPI